MSYSEYQRIPRFFWGARKEIRYDPIRSSHTHMLYSCRTRIKRINKSKLSDKTKQNRFGLDKVQYSIAISSSYITIYLVFKYLVAVSIMVMEWEKGEMDD